MTFNISQNFADMKNMSHSFDILYLIQLFLTSCEPSKQEYRFPPLIFNLNLSISLSVSLSTNSIAFTHFFVVVVDIS